MEGPVKERLTGALILVAALVIIVPEMLSGPDASVAVTGATPPADAGPPLQTYSMVLGDASDRPAGGSTPAPQPPAAEPSIATSAAPAAEPAADPAPSPTAAATATTPPAVTGAEGSSPQPDTAATPPQGRWWAQLGSFSARGNADRLASQLRAAGFDIDVSRVNATGKDLYRVRAGPVRDRADAQALQARLATAGHKSTVVAP